MDQRADGVDDGIVLGRISLDELSHRTGLTVDDICSTLEYCGFLIQVPADPSYHPNSNIPFSSSTPAAAQSHPDPESTYELRITPSLINDYVTHIAPKGRRAKPENLRWTPFTTWKISSSVSASRDVSAGPSPTLETEVK